MRRFLVGLLILSLGALAAAAPAKSPGYLKVKAFKPRHARTFVALEATLQVKFSRPVDRATVSQQTIYLRKLTGATVPCTYSDYRGERIVVLSPVAPLEPATDYQIVVLPGLMSTDGRTLRNERHANFFTETRVSPLSILRPDQFAPAGGEMSEGRAAHSAIRLASGRVLLAGGFRDYVVYATSGDVFDPVSERFLATNGQLHEQRAYHPCVRMGTGALLIGGSGSNGALASTEAYNAEIAQFLVGPRMLEERDYVAAVALRDGSVFVTGGLAYTAHGAFYSDTAEIYDPSTGGFRFTANAPLRRRAGHTATLLPDGRVLIVGGQSGGTSTPVSAEIFDPETETFTATTTPPTVHRQLHTATLIDQTGRVLLVDGGSGLLEMYDATLDGFYAAGGASSVNRTGATASLLPDGRVLICGGLRDAGGGSGVALDSFDIWIPGGGDNGSVLRASAVLPEPRYGHTATTLGDNRVLYAGGFGTASVDSLATGILFTPDPPK